jgi:peptidyl-prolyl cis-trans isomerase A (cyclophilin A)
MRSTLFALSLLTLAVGCEHKSKNDEHKNPPIQGSAKADPGGMKAEPVAKDPGGAQTVDKEVRPPTADDLARYTKDIPGNGPLMAKFETTMGTINCELLPDKAPMTVANFVGLATGKKAWQNPSSGSTEVGKPFYDGLTFHRVIPAFMIQGGDPLGVGRGGPGYQFADETSPADQFTIGALAMANAGPATNGSQFFITEVATTGLNGRHTIFGRCREIDIVKQITGVPRDPGDKPNTPVTMKVTITKG